MTGQASAAVTPLINNDVFLVVPKAFHALDVAIVEAFNVGAAVFTQELAGHAHHEEVIRKFQRHKGC